METFSGKLYLSQLVIEHFKSFKRVEFEFHPHTNILTGINNAGKTNVLEALALWHEIYTLLVRPAERSVDGQYRKGDSIPGTSAGLRIRQSELKSVRSSAFGDIFYNEETSVPIWFRATLRKEDRELEIPLSIKAKGEGIVEIRCGDDYPDFDFTLFNDRSFINDPNKDIRLSFANPVWGLPQYEERVIPARIKHQIQSRQSFSVFRNRLEILYDRGTERRFEHLCQDISDILSDGQEKVSFEFSGNELSLQVFCSIGKSRSEVSLLGSGTLQIIQVLLDIHSVGEGLDLLTMDEPDSHLHRDILYRLVRILSKGNSQRQLFLTTHNASLIREASAQHLFHIEAKSEATYRPVFQHAAPKSAKKGIQANHSTPVLQALGEVTSLDFVSALEADRLFFVEGTSDALAIQHLLNQLENKTKCAYWVMDGIDGIFSRLGIQKEIFEAIKNKQSIWEKGYLVFDKDCMTDEQSKRVSEGFSNRLGIDTHIWSSYCFESILLSDVKKLGKLMEKFSGEKDIAWEFLLEQAMKNYIQQYNIEHFVGPSVTGKLISRAKKLVNPDLRLNIPDAIATEPHTLYHETRAYYEKSLNLAEFHKLADKEAVMSIVQETFSAAQRTPPADFNDLLAHVAYPATWYPDWDFLRKIRPLI